MPQKIRTFAFAGVAICGFALTPAGAAEREQVRAVINLIAAVKMPYPEKLDSNQSRTEWVRLDSNSATIACMRIDDKQRWCYEHVAAVGARAEMLRIRSEPAVGITMGQVYNYVVDYDLDGTADLAARQRSKANRMPRLGWWLSSSTAVAIAATNSVGSTRSFMMRASKSRSSIWVNS